MSAMTTFRELFAYNDWGRDKLLALAAERSDEELDRPFEMGPGSLRRTLTHMYGAERVWYERCGFIDQGQFPASRDTGTIPQFAETWQRLADVRNQTLAGLADADGARRVSFRDREGKEWVLPLGDILLHVPNHGVHHRAQALNMLRHLGVEKPPGLDYLYMSLERPTVAIDAPTRAKFAEMGRTVAEHTVPPAPLDIDVLREYFRYGDWAFETVCGLAEGLDDAALDRDFEIGPGRLRKMLLHIRDAESWWVRNWESGPDVQFEELPETTPLATLRKNFRDTARRRDEYLSRITSDGLARVVTAEVRPGVQLSFRLGETMLQLCGHGTHHRAQAVNMLRRLGVKSPEIDYVHWYSEHGCASS